MRRLLFGLAALAAAGTFGAVGLTLALVGAGVPYIAATAAVALLAGAAAYAVLHALVARPPLARLGAGSPGALGQEIVRERARLAALEETVSSLRHDLRGLLSPAMLVSDYLIVHPDPKVARAGDTVVRSIARAIDRLSVPRVPSPEAAATSAQEPQPGAPAAAQQDHGVLPEQAAERLDPARGR